MISSAARLRLKPWRPVEQNEHSSAQPAWEETQSVPRLASGMKTESTAFPVPTSSSHLRVPSAAVVSRSTRGAVITACCAIRSRNGFDISVIAPKSSTPA
ncbi:hypothetical protein D3C83_48830 [compost metagenome]